MLLHDTMILIIIEKNVSIRSSKVKPRYKYLKPSQGIDWA